MSLFKHSDRLRQTKLGQAGIWDPKPQQPTSQQNVHDLNQVKCYGLVSPNYPQDLDAKRVIDFACLPQGKVLLLASMDGAYPYWVSVTDIDNVETNTDVANAILFDRFSSFTSTHPELIRIMDNRYRRRFTVSDGSIKTPFEYGFSSEPDQVRYWGHHVATGLLWHYREVRELCALRELDGNYLSFLRSYLEMMKTRTSDDDVRNYEDKRMLVKLLQSEDYLYTSEDESIRAAYVETRQEISRLYNLYMSIVR